MRSACRINPDVQSHQKAYLYLLPAISSPLTSYHTVPCSYPYCRSGSCWRGDELSAIGFSVRKHNHHSFIEDQAAFSKRSVSQRDVRTATHRCEPSGGMYGGTVHVGCKRNPLIPVGPVPVYIMSEALS